MISKSFVDRLVLLLLLLWAGNNPFFNLLYIVPTSIASLAWLYVLLMLYGLFRIPPPFSRAMFGYIFAGLGLLMVQEALIGGATPGRVARFFLLAVLPFLVLRFVDPSRLKELPLLMIRVIQFSLVIWGTTVILDTAGIKVIDLLPDPVLFPDIPGREGEDPTHAILHNFRGLREGVYFVHRNNGMFWEPGAFAGTILITYVYYLLLLPSYTRRERRRITLWFTAGVVSTFSTAGLLVLPVGLVLGLLRRGRRAYMGVRTWVLTGLILIASFLLFDAVPVLGEKIREQLFAVSIGASGSDSTRLGSLLFLLGWIRDAPFLGHGMFISGDTFADLLFLRGFNSEHAVGNGMFLYLAQVGIPFFAFIVVFWIRSFRMALKSPVLVVGVLGLVLLLLQGQAWMNYPLIYGLFFVGEHIRTVSSAQVLAGSGAAGILHAEP